MAEGTVIVIGGAEDKVRDRVILSRFVALAGGDQATIVVLSTASSLGTEAGDRYRRVFSELGAREVRPLHTVTRQQANDEAGIAAVKEATGVFLTGGNQLRLSSTIGGTRIAEAIHDRFEAGAVIAGTSAGASAMSSHMIAFGASGATPKQRMAQIAAGLGVLPGVIIDQHFQQRNRLGRLPSLIAQNPSLLGLVDDEAEQARVLGDEAEQPAGAVTCSRRWGSMITRAARRGPRRSGPSAASGSRRSPRRRSCGCSGPTPPPTSRRRRPRPQTGRGSPGPGGSRRSSTRGGWLPPVRKMPVASDRREPASSLACWRVTVWSGRTSRAPSSRKTRR